MWPLLYYSAFIILSLFPSVFYKFFNLHTFLTMTEFSRIMCGKVRGRWVWPTQLCCHKSLPWNLLHWKNCFCAASLGKWTVTGIARSSRTEALQLPCCGWISSALSMLCIAQLHERNHFGRSSITSGPKSLQFRNHAHLPPSSSCLNIHFFSSIVPVNLWVTYCCRQCSWDRGIPTAKPENVNQRKWHLTTQSA